MVAYHSRSTLTTIFLTTILVAVAVIPAAANAEITPTRILVGFHEYPLAMAEGDLYDGAVVVRALPDIAAMAVTTIDPVGFTQRQLADPNVRYVENDDPIPLLLEDVRREVPPTPDGVVPMFTPNDPQYSSMYGPQQVRANLAWDTTLGSTNASAVCVIDTGVRKTHEDLGAARYLGGYDFVNNDADPADDHGHGTHVTGSAVGAINNAKGVAGMGNSGYYHAKVLNSGGSGSWSNVAAGINWCANNGMARTVISMSLGGSGFDQAVADALHYAHATKGKIVVAAAGNSGCDGCVLYPAKLPEAVAVSCTDSAQSICGFSSRGPEVDIAAPGNAILSTCMSSDTSYCSMSGTSMSTPHVAGILALVWGNQPALTNVQLVQRMNETAKDLGAAGKDNNYGHGRIDAKCLIDNTPCSVAPPPQTPFQTFNFDASSNLPAGWVGSGLWHISTCKFNSAGNSLAYNKAGCPTNYDTGAANSGNVDTASISIPNTLAASLKFKSRYNTESGTSWDKKLVLVSANGGAFTQLFQESGTQGVWNDVTVDLTSYAGQAIVVRFRFDTVDSVANNYEGWYVDDVQFLAANNNATPPGPPTNLNATAGPGAGQISLSWQAPTNNGGAPITSYKIYRSLTASGTYTHVGTATTTSFVNSGLAEGTQYFYKVSAVNIAGEGAQSAADNATTFARPTAPLNLDARPGGALLSIDLTWQAPANNGGTPVTGYRVYRDGAFVGSSNGTSYRDSNLDPLGVYTYRVSAVNLVGEGPLSNEDCSRPSPWPMALQDTCEIL